MTTMQLTERRLLSMKLENLEKKVLAYFAEAKDCASVIEYAVVILLRSALSMSDFSFSEDLKEVIREVFMSAEPSDGLRHYCPYFKGFFKSGEWDKQVIGRLYKDKKEYQRLSAEARSYNNLLKAPGSGEQKHPDLQLKIVSVFEDANGKKHTLTLKDADESRTKAETYKLLEILTTLSIFQKDGVRRFVRLLKSARPGTIDTYEEEEQTDLQEESVQNSDVEPQVIKIMVPFGFDPRTLSENEVVVLAKAHLPAGASLENVQIEFVEKPEEEPPIEMAETQERAASSATTLTENANDQRSESPTNEQIPAESIDPPAEVKQNPKKQKALTNKQAYAQSLIANLMNGIGNQKGTNKKGTKKNSSNKKKNKRKK
ncbi:hypothetical protein IGI39_002487 [Enterococcus sp. AZ135]|uniref:hypothetical protein n=1 Tax=unclassified Enterococcus TaxID=2608891 RepID=UPI003F295879